MGFRYIWIDVFCIVQAGPEGDDEDWQQESLELTETYGNTFLTIIPLQSKSGDEGFWPARSKSARIYFFSKIKQRFPGACWIHEVPPELEDPSLEDYQQQIQLSQHTQKFVSEEKRYSRWNTRGWTFHEALMSPRKLRSGARSVEFECYGRHSFERRLRPIPILVPLENYHWSQSMDKHGNPRGIIGRFWTASKAFFTDRQFDRLTDRLPAISSFAKLINEKIGGD